MSIAPVRPPVPARLRLPLSSGPPRPRLVLLIILSCQLMVMVDGTVVNVALHDIRRALGFAPETLSWVVNAYALTFGGLLLLGARAGDLLGRRRVFLAGIAVFALASLLGGFAQDGGQLLAARAAQGIGGALASPSALALLMTMFTEPRERNRAIGLYTAVSVGGAALGLIAGGMLSEWVSWRWVFFINVPIGVGLLLVGGALVETPRRRGRFDVAGAVTSTLGMTAAVYGFVEAATHGWSGGWTIASFAAALVLLGTFVVVERRAEAPITPLRLFADRHRASSYLARLLLVAGMMGMFFFLTQFLRDVLGYSDLATGFAFLPLTVMVFMASQVSSRVLVERFGGYAVMLVGFAFSITGLLWLSQLDASSGYGSIVGPLLCFGLGNGLAFVPLTSAAIEGVDPADAGAASGLVNVMQQLGGAVGLAVLVTVFGSASRDAAADVAPGLAPGEAARSIFVTAADHAFFVAALFLVATWLMVATMLRPRALAGVQQAQ